MYNQSIHTQTQAKYQHTIMHQHGHHKQATILAMVGEIRLPATLVSVLSQNRRHVKGLFSGTYPTPA